MAFLVGASCPSYFSCCVSLLLPLFLPLPGDLSAPGDGTQTEERDVVDEEMDEEMKALFDIAPASKSDEWAMRRVKLTVCDSLVCLAPMVDMAMLAPGGEAAAAAAQSQVRRGANCVCVCVCISLSLSLSLSLSRLMCVSLSLSLLFFLSASQPILAACGYSRGGSLGIIHRAIPQDIVTDVELVGCVGTWAVYDSLVHEAADDGADGGGADGGGHGFLFLTVSDETMVM